MRIVGIAGVFAALGLMSGVLERTPIGEMFAVHHSHGLDGDSHEHGDADDHHESPDSPCHHHATHCCCSHVHAAPPAQAPDLDGAFSSERYQDTLRLPDVARSADTLPHVPRA